MTCRVCLQVDSYEDEKHTFSCPVLLEDIEVDNHIEFVDVFGNLEGQVKAVKYFTKIIQKRNAIITSCPIIGKLCIIFIYLHKYFGLKSM